MAPVPPPLNTSLVCVCLSVTFVDYVKTNNRIVKIFLPHHSSFSMTLNDL